MYDSISFREYKSKVANIAIRIDGLKPNKARNLRCRYLLVEDLSPRIIRWLGQTFWLNPEFFEEHLNASGYGRPGYGRQPYKDPSPSTWNTSAIPKDYISVRWFRPVHRSHMPPVTDADRLDLLNGKWAAAFYSLATNIFRKEWAIVSDPNRATSEYGTANAYPAVWEERATIHVSQVQGRPPICKCVFCFKRLRYKDFLKYYDKFMWLITTSYHTIRSTSGVGRCLTKTTTRDRASQFRTVGPTASFQTSLQQSPYWIAAWYGRCLRRPDTE